MLRTTRFAALALAALALGACATMTASSHVERGVNFAQYKTFDWGPADQLPTGDPRLDNNPFFKDHLEGAVEKAMAARHFMHAATGTKPDLLIHYHANVSQRFEVQGVDTSRGYCYDNCEPRVSEYEAGTLVIDMVDAKTNKVVWRGWAQDSMTGVIDNQTRLEKQIDEAVTKMMKELPNHL